MGDTELGVEYLYQRSANQCGRVCQTESNDVLCVWAWANVFQAFYA
jgi:hypothetical protein